MVAVGTVGESTGKGGGSVCWGYRPGGLGDRSRRERVEEGRVYLD